MMGIGDVLHLSLSEEGRAIPLPPPGTPVTLQVIPTPPETIEFLVAPPKLPSRAMNSDREFAHDK
jgi:hypothetical protein